MQKNLKYTLDPSKAKESFAFDHVHIYSQNQISLHQQDSWELSYIITGKGVRAIGDIIEHFSEGEIILIPPNIPHCWTFDESVCDKEGKIENITIVFTKDRLDKIQSAFDEFSTIISTIQDNKNAISFSGETLNQLQKTMLLMILQPQTERVSSLMKLLSIIATSDMAKVVGHPVNEDKKMKRIQSIYLYVMNNYPNHITLEDISKFVGMERASFCVFFKKMTGKSFFSYLTEYRIEASCQMLMKTTKTVAEICIDSGFRDVPYYNRMFKKTKNTSPSQYRKG